MPGRYVQGNVGEDDPARCHERRQKRPGHRRQGEIGLVVAAAEVAVGECDASPQKSGGSRQRFCDFAEEEPILRRDARGMRLNAAVEDIDFPVR